MILKLTWRNLWRNKRRTSITVASVTFAVVLAVSMKSLQVGTFDNLIKDLVSYYTGYVQLYQKGYWDEKILDNSFDNGDSLLAITRKVPNVSFALGRLESFSLVSSGSKTMGCMVVGSNPSEENKFTGLQSKVVNGKFLRDSDSGIMLAEELAEKLGINVNDTVIMMGQGFHGNMAAGMFPVRGLLHFGSPELNGSLSYLSLESARKYFSTGERLTSIAYNLKNTDQLQETSRQIGKAAGPGYEAKTWNEMMPEIEQHIKADNVNFYLFIGVLYLLIAFGIFGTILMMMTERKFEMGMLMAVGMKRRIIAWMLFLETIFISMVGTLVGLVISYPVVKYFELNPIRFSGKMAEAYKIYGFDPIWPATFKPEIFLSQSLIVLVLAVIVGMYPVVRIMGMGVMDAMKTK